MTFSGQVKNELSLHMSSARHCQIAEIAAIVTMCGGICISQADKAALKIHTENRYVARKYSSLLHRAFHMPVETGVRVRCGKTTYYVGVSSHENTLRVLQAIRMVGPDGDLYSLMNPEKQLLLQKSCCKKAYLRGAFLVGGSISDPQKFYHLEIVCADRERAEGLQELMNSAFALDARIVERKGHFVVYMKDGTRIVSALGIMEASRSLMELENIRILHEINNDVNRKVNCETANISKTVSAAVRQIQDIEYIRDHVGLHRLPPQLEEIALLRLEHPDTSLQDLGRLLDPPLGKSGTNHRLKKISEMARQLGLERPEG